MSWVPSATAPLLRQVSNSRVDVSRLPAGERVVHGRPQEHTPSEPVVDIFGAPDLEGSATIAAQVAPGRQRSRSLSRSAPEERSGMIPLLLSDGAAAQAAAEPGLAGRFLFYTDGASADEATTGRPGDTRVSRPTRRRQRLHSDLSSADFGSPVTFGTLQGLGVGSSRLTSPSPRHVTSTPISAGVAESADEDDGLLRDRGGHGYGSNSSAVEELSDFLSEEFPTGNRKHRDRDATRSRCRISCRWMRELPAVIVGAAIGILDAVPFGLVIFPPSFASVASVGVTLMYLTTIASQLVVSGRSAFRCGLGAMMVENLPFLHTLSTGIANSMAAHRGVPSVSPEEALATVLTAFVLASLVVGVAFLGLGWLRLGGLTHYFPRHVLVGCIGGIGLFLLTTGVSVSTGASWTWSTAFFRKMVSAELAPLLATALGLAAVLRVFGRFTKSPLLSPLFFVASAGGFYGVLYLTGSSPDAARAAGWLFPEPPVSDDSSTSSMLVVWQKGLLAPDIDWTAIVEQTSTLVALIVFSLLHVPINVPSLGLTTGQIADTNDELVTHGISNLLSALTGGLQNYLCYANSALFFQCGGGWLPEQLAAHELKLQRAQRPKAERAHQAPRTQASPLLPAPQTKPGSSAGKTGAIARDGIWTTPDPMQMRGVSGHRRRGPGPCPVFSRMAQAACRHVMGVVAKLCERWSTALVGLLLVGALLAGPELASMMPRCVAGLVMLHIGIELVLEAIVAPYKSLTRLEYGTVVTIAVSMTIIGFEEGVLVGLALACATFVVAAAATPVVRVTRSSLPPASVLHAAGAISTPTPSARSAVLRAAAMRDSGVVVVRLRSTRHRTAVQRRIMRKEGWRLICMSLQGNLFFGNVLQVAKMMDAAIVGTHRHYVAIDGAAVLHADCSASEAIANAVSGLLAQHSVVALIRPPLELLVYLSELDLVAAESVKQYRTVLDSVTDDAEAAESESEESDDADDIRHRAVREARAVRVRDPGCGSSKLKLFVGLNAGLAFLEDSLLRAHSDHHQPAHVE